MGLFGIMLIATAVNQFVGIPIDMDGVEETLDESRTVLILQHLGLAEGDTSADTGMSFHFNTFILLISILMFVNFTFGYILARGWRSKIIEIKKSEASSDESEEDSEDSDSEETDSEADSDDGDSEDADSVDDSVDDSEDEEDEEDDGVDVGDRVGVDLGDGEEAFGKIIEFIEEDDEEIVVVLLDDGDEVEVEFDMIFLED